VTFDLKQERHRAASELISLGSGLIRIEGKVAMRALSKPRGPLVKLVSGNVPHNGDIGHYASALLLPHLVYPRGTYGFLSNQFIAANEFFRCS